MLRIRTETLNHAHIPGDLLSLGVEMPSLDQLLGENFAHLPNCISLRLAASLYPKLDYNEQIELEKLCTTFNVKGGSLGNNFRQNFQTFQPTQNSQSHSPSTPKIPIQPLGTDEYLSKYTQVVSQCQCSLESTRRYNLTGSILTQTR